MSNKDNRQKKDYTDMKSHPETIDVQSGRMEAPASTLQKIMGLVQRCKNSVYLVQLSKSGKYASGKKVAPNTLILSICCTKHRIFAKLKQGLPFCRTEHQ